MVGRPGQTSIGLEHLGKRAPQNYSTTTAKLRILINPNSHPVIHNSEPEGDVVKYGTGGGAIPAPPLLFSIP
jgi:hypothetical protein